MGKADVLMIESRADQNRLALVKSVIEIRERLEPRRLVGLAVDKVGGKTATAASEITQSIKNNGGKAALFGAGLLLAFTTGRKSSSDGKSGMEGQSESGFGASGKGDPKPSNHALGAAASRRRTGLWDSVVAASSAAAAVLIGYVASGFVPVSEAERKVLGNTPSELKSLATAFIAEHGKGAKQFGAQSFGIASFAAMALALMAGLAGQLSPASAAEDGVGKDGKTRTPDRAI